VTALLIVAAVFAVAVALALQARRGREMSLEQWTVGGRGFGSLFVFLLMAGEIYTTFTFLGGSGWAYGKGGPAFYILCYGSLAFVMSYWLLPVIWRYGKQRGLVSQSDFFAAKYESPLLGAVTALVGVLALIPYLALQLKGLGSIVSETSGGAIPHAVAIVVGTVVLAGYVIVSGVRGSAWTAALKDVMILVVVVALGIYLPVHYFGGISQMFHAVDAAKPGFLTLPASGMSPSWFVSTVLLSSLGFYMWPHSFSAIYTARDEGVFRRNAIVLPLYQLILLFVFFVGFTAVLVVPGLKGGDGDLSLLRVVTKTFSPWFVGLVGGAGLLTALVPGSMILMTSATLLAKNLYRLTRPDSTDRHIAVTAKILVPVVALIALYFTFGGGTTIVSLLLMGYSLVTQLFPTLLLSLTKHRLVTPTGVVAGIVVGVAVVAAFTVSGANVGTVAPWLPRPLKDLNTGVVALVANLLALGIVTMFTRRRGAVLGASMEAAAA
jgi:solute:Na+ symporter, SSS family